MTRRMLAAAFASVGAVASARAQAVRGIVVDGADMPVAGVVVQLVDGPSHIAGRALTNERGEFRIVAVVGTYRIHTLRIGFRPTDSAPIALQSGPDVAQRIVLIGLPIGLDTMRVAGRNACRALNDSGAGFAVWEQIHAAVSAASLTAAAHGVFTTTISYERTLEPDGRHIRTQTSTIHSGYVRAPWGTGPPEALHTNGYVVTDRDNVTTYYAPGLEVLLSPSFAEDHCYHLTRDHDRLGLAFEPTPDRRKTPEIRGTLWLNAKTAELRSLEFRYSNVLPEQDAVAFGAADFIRIPNGMWAISQWSIRMPVLEQVVRSEIRGGARLQAGRAEIQLQVAAVHVAGGELALVRRGADTLWTRPLVALSGTVVDSTSGKAIARARVSLVGTNVGDSTDSRGRFSMRGVLLGDYTLEVRTPSLDSINALHQIPIAFTDSSAPMELRVPNATQFMSLVCGDKKLEWPGVVLGTVTSAGDSMPPRNAKVTAAWTQKFLPVGGQTVTDVGNRKQWLDTRTDVHGMFRLCGVPIDDAISLTVGDGAEGAPVVVRIPTNGRFARAELTLDGKGRADLAAFVGTVTDSAGGPVVAADVSLPALSENTVTDGSGAFRIDGVPPGTQHVLVRRLGYRAIDTSLAFSADRTVQRRFELLRTVTLDSVVVTEKSADHALDDFEINRKLGLGHFLTRAELAKQEGRSTAAVLTSVPGIKVFTMGPYAWVGSGRHTATSIPGRAGLDVALDHTDELKQAPLWDCYALVYVDTRLVWRGQKFPEPHPPPHNRWEPLFDINSIPVAEIEAIEYYASAAETPSKYATLNSQCGVLVIHTLRFHPKDTTSAGGRPPR